VLVDIYVRVFAKWIPKAMKCLVGHPQSGIIQSGVLERFHEVHSCFEIVQVNDIL
jgi:hypothetical protein